ncbi:hypothetical protein QRD43_21125 [Pelomonas sp. APW6]|uniref:Uncharacterized protein n=1 Tax=Roseateles subflavus TaxID=3053353 RepID=A0ABT7LPS4_9BURK|nr:hypothetical protein [Pelomonas sp. APW6]MDL5034419.1 hypothetical protein [Pelomonas sp. APW6]
MKAESKFWREVAQQLNPGWAIELPLDGASLAAAHDYLYVVDASTGWLKAGAIPVAETTRVCDQMRNAGQKIRDSAPGAAAEALTAVMSVRGTDTEAERARDALSASMLAVTQTETFRLASGNRNKLNGRSLHWIYIVYRLQRGVFVGRPAAIALSTTGFASPEEITSLVSAVMARDLDPTANTDVARQLRADGPLLQAA